jgi:N,N'-diacetylbacillosaminyl-diphospho-undecaprenol alpha-1,3-N-acetylgalactosaminyltransferase
MTASGPVKRIAFVAPTCRSVYAFRQGLIVGLQSRRCEVTVIAAEDEWTPRIRALGTKCIALRLPRFIDVVGDIAWFVKLFRILRRGRFDVVHTFTIKPNVYGSIAARLAGVQSVFGLVEGFGFLYGEDDGRVLGIRRTVFFALYRLAFKCLDKVWFINDDDVAAMTARAGLKAGDVFKTRGVGVDASVYSLEAVAPSAREQTRVALGVGSDDTLVMFSARMVWPKGVRELVDAEAVLRKSHPNVFFVLVGEIQQDSPSSVSEEYLREHEGPKLKWLGFRNDIRELLAACDIVVLPTYYREGVPRILLEAMAMKRAVVASDSVGCREVVRHEVNGLLVPPRDAAALAEAIGRLADSPDLRAQYGDYSRRWVEAELDERLIVERAMTEVFGLTESTPAPTTSAEPAAAS